MSEKIHITRTGATIEEDTPFEMWLSKVKSFATASLSSQWWIGDLLNIGEAKFGDHYTQVVNDLGVEESTLANWKWVAKSVAPEVRREELTWQHHRFVAKLTPSDQKKWLEIAVKKKMSSADLKSSIKTKMARDAEKRRAEQDEKTSEESSSKSNRYRAILVMPDWREVTADHLSDLRLPADQESACFLVIPSNKIREGVLLFESWNFVAVATAVLSYPKVFDKEWFRTSHELVLVGVRGELKSPPLEKIGKSIIECGNLGRAVLYDTIEMMFPQKNKKKTIWCDLLGTELRDGWDVLNVPETEEVSS